MAHYKPGMTAEAYRQVLLDYDLAHEGAGRYFGVSALTSMKWANDGAAIPKMMALLVALMREHKVEIPDVYRRRRPIPPSEDERAAADKKELELLAKTWARDMEIEAENRKKLSGE
jgi:hypothetical protein